MRAIAVFAMCAVCAACGAKAGTDSEFTPVASGALAPLDQTLSDYAEIVVTGSRFEPEAIGMPGMVRAIGPRRNTLARQREKVRGGGTRAEVHVLVTMLWDAAGASHCCAACPKGQLPCGDSCQPEGDACTITGGCACTAADAPRRLDQERELRAEALRELRELADRIGRGKADAVTLQMLAVAALWNDQPALAETAYRQLIERFPERPDNSTSQTWLVITLLRDRRVAEAAAQVDGWKPADIDPIAAYAMAWVRLSQRDFAPARAAMVEALRRWTGSGKAVVERDLLLILARGAADVAEAVDVIASVVGQDVAQQRELMNRLLQAYHVAGHYDRASAVADLLLRSLGAGDALSPRDRVAYRLQQADFQLRLGEPGRSAQRIVEAHRGLGTCAAACTGDLATQVEDILLKLAVFFHNVYHDSLDKRFYSAAETLYQHLIQAPGRRDTEEQRGKLANLKNARAHANPVDGKHGAQSMYQLAMLRAEVVKACYEAALLLDPQLVGTLVLQLEIDQSGTVIGAATQPTEGMEGIPDVARCAGERSRVWRFPARTVPGKTTMTLAYALAPQAPTASQARGRGGPGRAITGRRVAVSKESVRR
jgi:hypothetical protein